MAVPVSGDKRGGLRRRASVLGIVLATFAAVAIGETAYRLIFGGPPADGTVTVDLSRPVNTFDGTPDLGAGVDGLEHGEIDRVWKPENITAMRSAGYGPISFRLRTELGVKAWHWNAEGSFSDAANQQGYWTSSAAVRNDPGVSYGYNLPRRGNTIDQAKNDGYSRLDDGDPATFWKCNPYLDQHFTKESNAKQPQWIMVDFEGEVPVDTVQIAWGDPRATKFRVQYWTGKDAALPGRRRRPGRTSRRRTHGGAAGTQTVRVAPGPVQVQLVRILLTESRRGSRRAARDVRDRLGFAVRELSIGSSAGGVVRRRDQPRQVAGPDEDVRLVDRPVAPGIGHRPQLRARELRAHLRQRPDQRPAGDGAGAGALRHPGGRGRAAALPAHRGFAVNQIEMGEEPDGQLAQPEHYAALYRQVGTALRQVDPKIELGGPGYQTVLPDWIALARRAGQQVLHRAVPGGHARARRDGHVQLLLLRVVPVRRRVRRPSRPTGGAPGPDDRHPEPPGAGRPARRRSQDHHRVRLLVVRRPGRAGAAGRDRQLRDRDAVHGPRRETSATSTAWNRTGCSRRRRASPATPGAT